MHHTESAERKQGGHRAIEAILETFQAYMSVSKKSNGLPEIAHKRGELFCLRMNHSQPEISSTILLLPNQLG